MFQHESSYGRAGAAVSRRNWGNLRRSPKFKSDARFVVYPSWTDGAGDAARLLAIYGRNQIRPGKRTSTARTFPFVWAPSADGNRPARYGQAIVVAVKHYIQLDRTLHPPAAVPANGPEASAKAPAAAEPKGTRVVATVDHSRIRSKPALDAGVIRKVNRGSSAVAAGTVHGADYDVNGHHSNLWVQLIELDGKRLPAPAFSAAILWRRA